MYPTFHKDILVMARNKSSSPSPREMGEQLYWALGDLNFPLPLGGSAKWGEGLKSFTFFFLWGWEQWGFLYGRMGVSSSPTNQNFNHPSPTRKSLLLDSPQNFCPLPKAHHLPTKWQFSCYNSIKASFLTIAITHLLFLF